jgi:diguanylate cyclase (GGDEF)-like protein/PAS domain S-box-containing protein
MAARLNSGLIAGRTVMKLDCKALLANISDGVYFTDRDRTIIYWNQTAERITGFSAEEVIGNHCHDNILNHVDDKGRSLCHSFCPLAHTIKDRQPRASHFFLHHKQGHRIPINVRTMPLFDEKNDIAGAAEFFSDVRSYESMHQRLTELEQLALLDPLTQLPNRHHLEPEIDSRFDELRRMGFIFGLLFMDIDHFKRFNDAYGHDTGDKVLKTVARTLKAAIRPYDLVGRWGGEEFLGVIRNVEIGKLEEIGNRLRSLVEKSSVQFKHGRLNVTISVGGTLAAKGENSETLIARADRLMYRSKQDGRNRLTIG